MVEQLQYLLKINFNPRSPCGERPSCSRSTWMSSWISIHALLAESDNRQLQHHPEGPISIHALLAESDLVAAGEAHGPVSFQSTLSLRRATTMIRAIAPAMKFQSTLSLRRATFGITGTISRSIFQSTLSLRRATRPGTLRPSLRTYFNPRSPCGERPYSV